MNLPKLPAKPLRQEDQPGYEKEIWKPSWSCFCCQDTGIVRPHLVKLVIPEYNHSRDCIPICQKPGCKSGSQWLHLKDSIDMRLNTQICQELDKINRQDWQMYVQEQFKVKRSVNIEDLAQKMKMPGSRDRTEYDNQKVQQRKQEIENISHEEWIQMRQEYFGVE